MCVLAGLQLEWRMLIEQKTPTIKAHVFVCVLKQRHTFVVQNKTCILCVRLVDLLHKRRIFQFISTNLNNQQWKKYQYQNSEEY